MKIIKKIIISAMALTIFMVLLFAAGYLATPGDYSVPVTVAEDSSLPCVTINDVTYHSETFGDKSNPVVIIIHGGPGGDYRSLLPIKDLEDEYFLVFYDQRGTGLSPRVDTNEITVNSYIDDLDSMVDFYREGEAVSLVAHSWGGMLASFYIGKYPEKVDKLVLAEPGFLTPEGSEYFFRKTKIKPSLSILLYFIKVKFESLHINGADKHASSDYFMRKMNLYQGEDHPQSGYRGKGISPDPKESWRNGAAAADALFKDAVDEEGNFRLSFINGVDRFDKKILFLTGAFQSIIGEDWQRKQMTYFTDTELIVIPDAGHEMFYENPGASVKAVRTYLDKSDD